MSRGNGLVALVARGKGVVGKATAFMLAAALVGGPVCAQQSTSFKLNEHVLNVGGHPSGGTVMASANFKVTLDALGESVVQRGMTSTSFRMDASFASAYPPPGEAMGLVFTDDQTLDWSHEQSAGTYDLYRDDTADGYGTCEQSDLPGPPATDASNPAAGNAFFYLVTVKNRLREEGTKGFRSDGAERLGLSPSCLETDHTRLGSSNNPAFGPFHAS